MSRKRHKRKHKHAYPQGESFKGIDYIRYGRRPLFESPQELAHLCNVYLNSTDAPTILGLYQHVGITRALPGEWKKAEKHELFDVISRARDVILANYEQIVIQQGTHKAFSKMERPQVNIMGALVLLRIEAPDRYGDFALKDQYERRAALEQISSGDVIRNDVVKVEWNGDNGNKSITAINSLGDTGIEIRDKRNDGGTKGTA